MSGAHGDTGLRVETTHPRLLSNSSCVPRSAITPSLRTKMQSAFWMVERRCAMAMVVRFLAASSRARWTTFSDSESSAEVALPKRHKVSERV